MALWRLGAYAAIGASVTYAFAVFNALYVTPRIGLGPQDIANPAKVLSFVAAERTVYVLLNIPGAVLLPLFLMALFVVLGDRLSAHDGAFSRLGAMFGLVGAVGFGTHAFIPLFGYTWLAEVSHVDPVGASQAFHAVRAILVSIHYWGHIPFGLGITLLGVGLAREGAVAGEGYLAIALGLIYALLPFVDHSGGLYLGASSLMILWLTWIGLFLRSESKARR